MTTELTRMIEYFQPPEGYFWQWAEKGTVIEWSGGDTICYTDDLATLFNALVHSHLPSFGAVLLLLHACKGKESSAEDANDIAEALRIYLPEEEDDTDNDLVDYPLNQAAKCINMIAGLPEELRTGMKRAHLLHEVFKNCKPVLEESDIRSAVDEWKSGRIDAFISQPGKKITRAQFKEDIACLVSVFHKYGSTNKLAKQLKASIFQMPVPLPVTIPEPESKPGDFWEQLGEEKRTAGIASLAKHIMAALRIPMHTQGSSDQPYGGISDITNRGSYDRLLLTELAHDDHTLLARLANNEALYLQREQPPHHPKKKRIILADVTLKMWGLPKVFAVSAAIACTMNTKHKEIVEGFALKGNEFTGVDFSTAEGVWASLEMMDHSLNCFAALEAFCAKPASAKMDSVFITRNEVLHDVSFQKILFAYPDALSFLLGIDRVGQLHFYSVTKGKTKLLSTAKFDLEEILSPKKELRPGKKKTSQPACLPQFFSLSQAPLLFPAAGMRIGGNSFHHPKTGVLTVTDNFRLLHWKSKDKGGVGLLSNIENGYYSFGYGEDDKLYLLITAATSSHKTILYTIDAIKRMESRREIDINGSSKAVYSGGQFFVKLRLDKDSSEDVAVIDCKKGTLDGIKPYRLCMHIFLDEENKYKEPLAIINRFVNNGYNILQRFASVAVSQRSVCLCLNKKILCQPDNHSNHLSFRMGEVKDKKEAVKDEETYSLPDNEYSKLTYFRWTEGSEAIVDARGFLHLVSSDKTLPEVSLVLIQNKTMTGWASDGTHAGNDYFIPGTVKKKMAPDLFYRQYITPILERINRS